jgi:hypothetical protein
MKNEDWRMKHVAGFALMKIVAGFALMKNEE